MLDHKVRKALTENLTVPVELAGRALGLSRGSAYQAVRAGQIPNFKIGQRFVVPTAPLRKMLGLDEADRRPRDSSTAPSAADQQRTDDCGRTPKPHEGRCAGRQ
jgi:hypothetical protein